MASIHTSAVLERMNAPMALPACAQHGQMELQQPGTPEQARCGVWYRCMRCGSSELFTSPQLQRDLDAARVGGAA